jgi:hypothetical protein
VFDIKGTQKVKIGVLHLGRLNGDEGCLSVLFQG